MTDDCNPGIHPHSDQPNWRPEDDPVYAAEEAIESLRKRVAHGNRIILRNLARLRVMALRLAAEELADVMLRLGVRPGDVQFLALYLEEVATKMAKQNKRPKRKCAECGESLDWDYGGARPDARYCNARCRQKAYRKRKTAKAAHAGPEA